MWWLCANSANDLCLILKLLPSHNSLDWREFFFLKILVKLVSSASNWVNMIQDWKVQYQELGCRKLIICMQLLGKPYEGGAGMRLGGREVTSHKSTWVPTEFCDTLQMRRGCVRHIVLRKLCPELYGGSTCWRDRTLKFLALRRKLSRTSSLT